MDAISNIHIAMENTKLNYKTIVILSNYILLGVILVGYSIYCDLIGEFIYV